MSILVDSLSFSYCTRGVLENVSFCAENGELIAVMGPNGVGKTTLFNCVLGLLPRCKGQIEIDGENAKKLGARELAKRLASIPQSRPPVFGYTALEMTLMGTAHTLSIFGAPRKAQEDIAMDALERAGAAGLAHKNYAHLSGGEQQLVMIARALAQNSANLLMDEPASGLDYGNQSRIMKRVRALADSGSCVVLSTHDPQHALWYADKALVLKKGTAVAFGSPESVLTPALLSDVYGVDVRFVRTDTGSVVMPLVK